MENCDYWRTSSDWLSHVEQSIEHVRDLIRDWDETFLEATKVLSDAYLLVHQQRSVSQTGPGNELNPDDVFWSLDRWSTVSDSVVGAACVVLMRWMNQAKRLAIGAFDLLETKFPFEPNAECYQARFHRLNCFVMQGFGSIVPGKKVSGAYAIWQMGNVFKHASEGKLNDRTKQVASKLGFSSDLLEIPEHAGEDGLREFALREVGYTLGADSIERMALQLGCSPTRGLMPLYEHVESWRAAIDEKLGQQQAALKGRS